MSLQVWLPLNGNLNNQGLSNITFTGTPSWKTSGKIGTSALNLSSRITFNCPELNGTKYFSVCFWGMTESNPDSTANWMDLFALSDKTANGATAGTFRFETGYGAAAQGGIHWHDNATNAIINGSYTYNTASEFGQWHHICVTVSDTKVCSYYDGVLKQTHTSGLGGGFITGAGWIGETTTRGGIQDIRIYDHALSKKEVEEISKGLILHYKLDGNGKGNDNILINTHFDNRYTQSSGWDTSKNGTLLANSWGGYNSGVSNQATVYHAHLKEFDGEYVYEYIRTANETWLGISQGGLQTKIVAGQTYTFSWEEYHVDGVNRVGTGLYYFKTGATSANFHLGVQSDTSVTRVIGQWQKYSYTFTAPNDADYNKNISWYIYGHYNGNGTFYMRYPKLELGNSATSWTPNSNDRIYNLYNTSIIYDSSGYFNQGSIIGSIEFSNETPRYHTSTYIKSPDPTTNSATGEYYISGDISLIAPTAITISWWARPENGYGGTINHAMWSTTANGISSDYQVSAFNHRDTGFDVNSSDGVHLRLSTSSFTKNEWHHYAVVYDGQTAYLYKDGIQQTSTAFSASKTLGNFTKILIGHSRAGGVHRKMLGKYSDFRVYCTALTAEQIKELYNTSATIDNNGNIYAREVIE